MSKNPKNPDNSENPDKNNEGNSYGNLRQRIVNPCLDQLLKSFQTSTGLDENILENGDLLAPLNEEEEELTIIPQETSTYGYTIGSTTAFGQGGWDTGSSDTIFSSEGEVVSSINIPASNGWDMGIDLSATQVLEDKVNRLTQRIEMLEKKLEEAIIRERKFYKEAKQKNEHNNAIEGLEL